MGKIRYFTPIIILAIALIPLSMGIFATTGLISPNNTTVMAGQSVEFQITIYNQVDGLTYQVEVQNPAGVIEYTEVLTIDTNGKAVFDYTFNDEGTYYVFVYEVDNTTKTLLATATVKVMDIISTIMPYFVLIISISIVFAIYEELKKAF